jgi:DNA-binding IclR family transcriptional regulator
MSTAVRLCATLVKLGYLKRNDRGVYFIGPQIEKLAKVFRKQFNLEEIVRPVLKKLREQTEESASFYMIDGNERVCLFREDSKHEIRHVVAEGTRLPLNCGVVGPLLLAFTGMSGINYKKIRDKGYYESEGRESYTASVAAPVFDSDGKLAGALVISGPALRFGLDMRREAKKLLIEEAARIKSFIPSTPIIV